MPVNEEFHRNLPVPADAYRALDPMRYASGAYEPRERRDGAEDSVLPLGHYFWILKRHRWKILSFVLAGVLATFLVSSRLQPVYESTVTIDIDRQMPTGVIGQEATRTSGNDSDQFLATQMRLMQSDSVLRPVARKYRLLEVEGLTGSEQERGAGAEEAPIALKHLRVERPRNTYLVHVSYRSTDPRLAADVANAVAHSYLEHTFNIRYRSSAGLSAFMEKQLEELRAKVEQSSAALAQFERELNVINPEEKTSIIASRLMQLNTEFTTAQADRVRKEAAYRSVQSGTLEAAQVSTQGDSLRRLGEKIEDAQARFAEIRAHYGANHPEYKKAAAQLAEARNLMQTAQVNIARRVDVEYREAVARETMLAQAVSAQKTEFDRLNSRSFEYQTLKREAEADKKLYEELVRKIKEAGINASFQNSSIRIADLARPAMKPVYPNIKLNVLLAFFASLLLAFAVAILSDLLDNTLRDPEQVARTLSAEVVGSLPVVKNWRGLTAPAASASTSLVRAAEGVIGDETGYHEAIRTLRNSILLTDFDRRLRSILLTSAGPGEGKSTIAVRLAMAHAEQHRRTLIIDGDLRRPSVHRKLGLSAAVGLSNVILSDMPWTEALTKLDHLPDLDVLTAGPVSRRASELLERRLLEILEEASTQYDLVILDGPPLPGFAEPLYMATAVDGVVVVGRAGQTSRKAVASVLGTLTRLRANVLGIVLNEVHKEMSDSYYYYGTYGKYYRPHQQAEA
ncbi:MAG: polysaccharide biosynthesis tyrosine autokinase [Bryobacterales bacterium]|nr:polysaccharide biosynthesis tyrosine autokinase [Bryobacterales bacterium]